jgi:hypothetical protein
MKSLQMAGALVIAALLVVLLLGCGAGHRKLVKIAVSPTTATAMSSTKASVTFAATGTFDNNSSRELSRVDGLTWMSSNTAVATIDSSGVATCFAPGAVTITATAPVDLVITVGTTVSTTSPKISGSANLSCT